MRIIDRYIVREVLLPFLLFLSIFTFILVIPFLIQYAEDFIAKGVPLLVVARVMATLLPQALALAIPAALLIALLWAFGRLSSDREFVAIQACGIGLARLLRPVGVVCLAGWAATSYVMLVALPDANQTFREITFSIVASQSEGEIKPRVFFDNFPNLVIYAREVPAAGGWTDVFIADSRPGQVPAVYMARHGRVAIDRTNRTVQLVLEDGSIHSTESGEKYTVNQFSRVVVSVDPESVFPRKGPQKEENEMTIAELRTRAAELESLGGSSHNQVMAIHRKFAFPVACLVFGLIGLALGATNRRDGKLGSFVFGLGVIFVYYVPLYLGPAMAKGQLLSPWLAVWLPNILLGALGCVMLAWRARAADQPITWRLLALVERFRSRTPGGSEPRPAPTSSAMSRILDRYVGLMYARIFLLAAAGLAGMFYISTFLDLSDKVFKAQASWQMLGAYLWYITPQYLYYVLPMAVLLSALVTIGLLTKNSELIVMKACGISLYRVAVPMLAGAIVAGGALFLLDQSILGTANRRAEAIRHVMRGGSPETFDVLNRQWLTSPSGDIYHFSAFDPASQRLVGLEVFQFASDRRGLAKRLYADRATYSGTGDGWTVDHGWTRDFTTTGVVVVNQATDVASVQLAPASYFATQRPDPKFMNYGQLRDYISELRASGFDVSEQRVALERKISFPFVTIIMTLIAVPFAVTTGRGGAMFGIAVGIGLAISYWVAISVFAALGAGGVVAPTLAAWAPNVLFGSGAAYLLLTVRT